MAGYDQEQSARLGQRTPVENPGIQLVTGVTMPVAPWDGMLVYRTDDEIFQVYSVNEGAWLDQELAGSGSGNKTFVSDTPPAADDIGDLWIDTSSPAFQLNYWDGDSWEEYNDPQAQAAADDAAAALAAATQSVYNTALLAAQQRASDVLGAIKTELYYQPAPPTAGVEGDFWVESDNADAVYIRTGTTWLLTDGDPAVMGGYGGNVEMFFQQDLIGPSGLNGEDSSFTFRPDGTTWYYDGTAWVDQTPSPFFEDLRDEVLRLRQAYAQGIMDEVAATIVDGEINTYYQAADPSLTETMFVGDVWFKTDKNLAYRWVGSKWEQITDAATVAMLNGGYNARAAADSKIVSFFDDDEPVAQSIGDIWYDTDNGNLAKRWDGLFWQEIPVQGGSILPGVVNGSHFTGRVQLDTTIATADEPFARTEWSPVGFMAYDSLENITAKLSPFGNYYKGAADLENANFQGGQLGGELNGLDGGTLTLSGGIVSRPGQPVSSVTAVPFTTKAVSNTTQGYVWQSKAVHSQYVTRKSNGTSNVTFMCQEQADSSMRYVTVLGWPTAGPIISCHSHDVVPTSGNCMAIVDKDGTSIAGDYYLVRHLYTGSTGFGSVPSWGVPDATLLLSQPSGGWGPSGPRIGCSDEYIAIAHIVPGTYTIDTLNFTAGEICVRLYTATYGSGAITLTRVRTVRIPMTATTLHSVMISGPSTAWFDLTGQGSGTRGIFVGGTGLGAGNFNNSLWSLPSSGTNVTATVPAGTGAVNWYGSGMRTDWDNSKFFTTLSSGQTIVTYYDSTYNALSLNAKHYWSFWKVLGGQETMVSDPIDGSILPRYATKYQLPALPNDVAGYRIYAAHDSVITRAERQLTATGKTPGLLYAETIKSVLPAVGADATNQVPAASSYTGLNPFELAAQVGGFELRGDSTGDWPELRAKVNAERHVLRRYADGVVNISSTGATKIVNFDQSASAAFGITVQASNTQFLINKTARYQINVALNFDNVTSNDGLYTMRITRDGGNVTFSRIYKPSINTFVTLNGSICLLVNAGSYISVECEQTTGVTVPLLTGSSVYCRIDITDVGD